MGKFFGTDGFRGEANVTLTAQHAFWIGRYLGYLCSRDGKGTRSVGEFSKSDGRARIVIGKDTRRSSYMLEYALAAGIAASGADAYLLHVTTTPSVSYVVRTEGFDLGVMISASHNPFSDNGIKLIGRDGEKADEAFLQKIEEYLDGAPQPPYATGDQIGRTVDYVAGRNRYLGFLLSIPHSSFCGFRVGLDCANGSAFAIAKAVFDALGAEVYLTGAEPDGLNVNRGCGSTHPEALSRLVKQSGLDVGFAFDGDADRCIAVDEKGQIVDGDGILYLAARQMKARGELRGDGVALTVMSNSGLIRSLHRLGIQTAVTPVGDRFVLEEMRQRGFVLGGEQSGHIIFRKYLATGDGILTALLVMETMIGSKCPLSCLVEGLDRLPQALCSVRVRDKTIVATAPVQDAVKEAKKLLGGGRILLRPSGTEPLIRILAEGESEEAAKAAVALVARAVEGGDVCAES